MRIEQKTGKRLSSTISEKNVDWLDLQWYEAEKRILHKRSRLGTAVVLRFLEGNAHLTQGDILFEDNTSILAVHIVACESIVVCPKNMFEMASVCYEIGNKHLPVFYANEEIIVAYEAPLFKLLELSGIEVKRELRQLINPLKTSVAGHLHERDSETLFSKVMKLTSGKT
jgi:urease accessory protein